MTINFGVKAPIVRSVTSPIVLTSSTLSFDNTANFAWTGAHTFDNAASGVTLKEDTPLFIGDNASLVGNLSLIFDSAGQEVLLRSENSYSDNGLRFRIEPPIIVNDDLSHYSQFGTIPANPVPSATNDTLVVGRQFDGSVTGGKRAGLFEIQYTGSTNHSGFNSGLNSVGHTTSASSGNLTATTQAGGLTGGRYRTVHNGSGTVSLSSCLSVLCAHNGTGATTNAVGLQIEAPTTSSTGQPTNWFGILIRPIGTAISLSGDYGIYIGDYGSGFPVWFDTAARCYFRETGIKIWSDASASLSIESTTTQKQIIGGTTKVTLTSSTLVVATGITVTLAALDGVLYGTAGVVSAVKPNVSRSFTPLDNQPPATKYATLSTRNNHLALDFDDTTLEAAIFADVLGRLYPAAGIKIIIGWIAKTATSGNVVWTGAWERCDTSTDLDTDSFASAQTATGAASGTSGIMTYTEIEFSNSEIDGLLAGERFRLKIERNTASGSDTMTGDAQVLSVECRAK